MSDSKLQSLSEIFNQKIFRIPDYQRGYSWNEDQLDDFWDDLNNLKADNVHYTGLLTVEPVKRKSVEGLEKWQDDIWMFEKGMRAYYVVDGQQRLTTSIILISRMLEKFSADEGINFDNKENWISKFLYQTYKSDYRSYVFGYERDNPSDEFFKTRVLNQRSMSSDKVPEQTLYTSNLEFAKFFFDEKLEKLEKGVVEELFKRLVTRFKFNFYEIDDDLDVFVTFETMNNRGKALSSLELLKNRLIYLSTLISDEIGVRKRLRADVNEVWKTLYEFLGKNKEKPLDDDQFLLYHWIMYFKYDRSKSKAYAHFLLHEKFTVKGVVSGALGLQDINDYIDSLALSVRSWFYITNIQASPYSADLREWVGKLNRLGLGAFPPLLIAAFNRERDEKSLLSLVQAVERFIFLIFRISQRQSNTKNSHFYRLANMYCFGSDYWGTGTTDLQKVIHDIKWQTDGETEDAYHGWYDLRKFQDYLTDCFKKEEGYYSWGGLRYFLYEYELYLRDRANGDTKVKWGDFQKRKKEDTIEHIYPQNPKGDDWKSAFAGFNKGQKKRLLHSLGNLLLLSQSKNSSLQNNSFDYKKRHERDDCNFGYYNGSYSEIEVATFSNWDASTIRERGEAMLRFMNVRWDMKFETWEGVRIQDLLHIDF